MSTTYFEFEFFSSDAGATEQHLADTYGRIEIRREFKGLTNRAAGDDRFHIADGRFDGSCISTIEIDQFMFGTATAALPWQDGRDSGDMAGEPAVFQPHSPYTVINEDTEGRGVGFDSVSLQRTAGLLYGREDLETAFAGPYPATPAAGRAWLSAFTMARGYQQSGLLRDDLIRASVYRLLAVTAIESFRMVGDRHALHASAERQAKIYRSAADYMNAFASLPITIDDAAEAAGASVPELVLAFRAHTSLGHTPTAYLQRIRLRAAHQDLCDADPTRGDTVTEISRRWGFSSPSRLAALFRAEYGVSPKWVLDR